jgi:hypothetical protein
MATSALNKATTSDPSPTPGFVVGNHCYAQSVLSRSLLCLCDLSRYLYQEIAKHTLSNFDASKKVVPVLEFLPYELLPKNNDPSFRVKLSQVMSFLLTRLQNKNANVKWKCLQVVRHGMDL